MSDLNPPPSYPARFILAALAVLTVALGVAAAVVQAASP